MDPLAMLQSTFGWVDPRVMAPIERLLTRIPFVRAEIEKEYEKVMGDLERTARPYRDRVAAQADLPLQGRNRSDILQELQTLQEEEAPRWKDGFVSGGVYHGDPEHVAFLNAVYALASQSNPLHSDIWPSIAKLEAEIVSMTARQMGGSASNEVCGTISSGGTESILLAMKTYRDRARAERGITKPELVLPITAHVAFDKACQYFGIKAIRTPVGSDGRALVAEAKAALTRNTVAMVGSAPCFPYGVIDPIEELSELARARGIGFHTDACLGGFVLPFAQKLGYEVPGWNFSLPGVTSISTDPHKFGYAAKGVSVVLYRDHALRRHQYYTTTEWPGGMYFSPSLAGSRSGGVSAACWAAMVSLGEEGYMQSTRAIVETASRIKAGIRAMPELELVGDSLFIPTFRSSVLDVYRILDFLTKRHWNLSGLHRPPAVHLCVTLRHTQPGVAERLISDLGEAVAHVKSTPAEKGGMAPVYGMANALPMRGVVSELLKRYMDVLYRV